MYGVYTQIFDSQGNKIAPGAITTTPEPTTTQIITTTKQKRTTAVGTEIQVNTYTNGNQQYPEIANLGNGNFVITWDSDGQDGSGYGVYAQIFDISGNKLGPEFQVNTHTNDRQDSPSIASLSNGGFVIAWFSRNQDGFGWGIYAQRFDSTGSRLGLEFRVNTYTSYGKGSPSVTSLSNGSFVIAWDSNGQDGSNTGIYAQRYNSSGNKLGSEFLVNTYTNDSQERSSITSLSDGGFVISWYSRSQDVPSYGVYAQKYDSNGNKIGSELLVNTYVVGKIQSQSITSLSNGGFVVTWVGDGNDIPGSRIYAQIFNSSGAKVGSRLQVNTSTSNYSASPSITPLSNGSFVITWRNYGRQAGSYDYNINAQIFDSQGNKIAPTANTAPTTERPMSTGNGNVRTTTDSVLLAPCDPSVDECVNSSPSFPNPFTMITGAVAAAVIAGRQLE